jgi:hypothetical protein
MRLPWRGLRFAYLVDMALPSSAEMHQAAPSRGPLSLRDAAITSAGASSASLQSKDRWIVVDDFDRLGRRYLVARHANDVDDAPRGKQTDVSVRDLCVVAMRTQGRSIKAIAIDMMLAPSTICSILRRVGLSLGNAWAARLVLRAAPGRV